MEHFTREGAEQLPDLASQSSPIEPGRYVVKHENHAEAYAWDDQIQSTVWFRTPPLTGDIIRRITALRLFAESHDQGDVGDRSQGNWTWFEFAIFKDHEDALPRVENGVQLVEFYHVNHFGVEQYEWLSGRPFERRKESLLSLLEDGNTIGVRICARFPGWSISARTGYLVVEVGREVVERKPPLKQMGQIAYEIKKIDEIINEVNICNDATFKPSVPTSLYHLDEINRGVDEAPLRVLCLDGGGVRGLASLNLLQALMAKIDPANPDQPPCKVFDMIGGTSTGGLIAIMLGCLQMNVRECIDQYKETMKKVFEHSIWNNGRLVKDGARYIAANLERETKALIKARLGDEDALLFDQNNDCKVFVMSVDSDRGNNSEPVFLRSYTNRHAMSELTKIKIWQAARATSAAPTYFEPLKINGRRLVDGGLAANNPLGWLWTEVVGVFGPARSTSGFVSIGTGIPASVPLPDNIVRHPIDGISALAGIATNTEIVHVLFKTLIDLFAPDAGHKKYWRLNIRKEILKRVKEGFLFPKEKEIEVKMDDVDDAAREALEQAAAEYIAGNDALLEKCAEGLRS